jgi:cytochrome c
MIFRFQQASAMAVLLTVLPLAAAAQDRSAAIRRGERLVVAHCSMCHAVDRAGTSPNPLAPPFRTIYGRYPAESMVESLGEGLVSGHPSMPTFVFSPRDVDAILSYFDSIQQP